MALPVFTVSVEGDWAAAQAMFGRVGKGALKRALMRSLHAEGNYLAGLVKQKIKNGPHTPLSKLTIAGRRLNGKRGTKPLIATGSLYNAITVYPPTATTMYKFIGVLRTARARTAGGQFGGAKDQSSLINVAQIQEEGRTFIVRVTPAMRKFFFGVLLPKAKGTPEGYSAAGGSKFWTIHIPARPFLGPTWAAHGGQASADRIMSDITVALQELAAGKGKE